MSDVFRRPLALTMEGELLLDPYPETSQLIFGASGSAKTTTIVVTTAQAVVASPIPIANTIYDVKNGEVSAQIGPMCHKYGVSYGHLDDFKVHGADHPDRYSLNPFQSIVSTAAESPDDLLFAIESSTHALIPEVPDDSKNEWFRSCPREELDTGIRILLENRPDMVTPGSLYSLMSDSQIWRSAREVALEEGTPALKVRSAQSLDMQNSDPEHYYQHLRAALSSLKDCS